MSTSTQNIDLDDIARKLLLILSYRKKKTCGSEKSEPNKDYLKSLFENIYPYFKFSDPVFYLPQQRPKLIGRFLPWKTAYSAAVLNEYIEKDIKDNKKGITVGVDSIIGEAIQRRISKYTAIKEPRPYEFQMKTLATALAVLDPIRKNLRDGNIVGVKEYFEKNDSLSPAVIATLASTGGGKTEIFEALALQLTLDSFIGASKKNEKALADFTKAIFVYPMKAFMIDHFRRFVEDVTYINSTFLNREEFKEFKINIGILYGDTPQELTSKDQILSTVEYLLYNKNCPICGGELDVKLENEYPYYSITCKNGHHINIIISKYKIFEHPPDILLTTIDAFNYILLEPNRHKLLGKDNILPPLLLAVDEPHMYTGVFGSNVSLIFRAFDYVVQQYIKSQTYKSLKIATSATMPHAQEFLAKLFVESENGIKIIEASPSDQEPKTKDKGILALLPDPSYGFRNATVEIIPLIAGLLPKELRKVLVFVDSKEYAETLKKQIEDFISKNLPDFSACLHLLQKDVYDPITKKVNRDAIRVAVHTGNITEEQRKEIEIGLRSTPPEYNIVIATPTLEVGIDIGDITVVVIAGLPPTPEKFAQRVGRAGRRGKGLVVIIGNESSGVDRYYLADNDKLIDYLHMSLGAKKLDYMLPLNPLNLESTRRFLGNFMAIYANAYYDYDNHLNIKVGQLAKLSDKIVKSYMNISINRVYEKLSSSQSKVINNVASFAKSVESEIDSELKHRFQRICKVAGDSSIKSFVAPGTAIRLLFESGKLDFVPVLDNIRSTKRFVSIEYYDSVNTKKHKINATKEDVERALASYAISEIEPTITSMAHEYILNNARRSNKNTNVTIYPLRGTLRYYSYGRESELFEVSGLYYNIYSKKHYDILVDSIKNHINNLNILSQTSAQIDKEIKKNNEIFSKYYKWINVTTIRVYNLRNSLIRFLKVTSQNDTHIVEPRAFYLLKSGILGRDKNNNDLLIRLWPKGKKTEQIVTSLEYFESFKITSGKKTYWDFSKIVSIKCPICNREDTIELKDYDKQYNMLILYCRKCNKLFKFPDPNNNVINMEIHMLKTKPVFFNLVIEKNIQDRQLADKIISVSSPLRKINVFIGNVGFRISSTSNKKVSRFVPTLSRGSYEQYIVGTDYETQGIEIDIDWIKQADTLQKLRSEIIEEFRKIIKLEDIPPNLNMLNDFKIRVTHTLSHMIINFAPIYTGGNRWDINEYLDFETDNNGDIIRSRIVIFDTDEGGNGVSELIKHFFNKILITALNEATKYYIGARDPVIRFIGEPGITLFGVWPICPYSNLGISRSLTLLYFKYLLNKQSIDELQDVKSDELARIGLEEEK